MKKAIIIPFIIAITTVLAGCSQKQSTSVNIDQPAVQSTAEESTTLTPNSSGDVDKDLEEIEAAIDSLDIKADFPAFDSDSI